LRPAEARLASSRAQTWMDEKRDVTFHLPHPRKTAYIQSWSSRKKSSASNVVGAIGHPVQKPSWPGHGVRKLLHDTCHEFGGRGATPFRLDRWREFHSNTDEVDDDEQGNE